MKGEGRQKRAHISDENGSWKRTGSDDRFQSRFIFFNESAVHEKMAKLFSDIIKKHHLRLATNSLITVKL